MKFTHYILLAGFIITLAGSSKAGGQFIAFPAVIKSSIASFLSSEIEVLIPHKLSPSNVPPKALKDFRKKYSVTNETWLKTGEGYISIFKNESGNTRTYYNRNGSWTFLQKSYLEKNLPNGIRKRVKRKYSDYSIQYVHEIHQNEPETEPVYLVLIRHKNDAKWIKITSVGISIYEEITCTD